jgi:hypothetical protein
MYPSYGLASMSNITSLPFKDAAASVYAEQLMTKAAAFLGGSDPRFQQHTGVYGQSDQQGVMGLSTADQGTGVFGGNTIVNNHGIGVRGSKLEPENHHGDSKKLN